MLKFDALRAIRILLTQGPRQLISRLQVGTYAQAFAESLNAKPWLDTLDKGDARRLQTLCQTTAQFSLIIDARNAPAAETQRCLDSLFAQYWMSWDVILLVTASQDFDDTELADDNRVTVLPVEADASQADCWHAALPAAQGDWIGTLPVDATLTPDALTWLLLSVNRWPEARCLYTDSVGLDDRGRCVDSQFKPDFSPEHLLASHFTGDLTVFRREAIEATGGLRKESGQAARFDLELRFVDTFGRESVRHVDRAVCHRHSSMEPASPLTRQQQMDAVTESLSRRDISSRVESHPIAANVNHIELSPSTTPSVTIFIATRNAASLVKNCVQSIRERTSYTNYDIVVINNRSDEAELLDWLAEESDAGRLSVFDYDREFNYSEMHNFAIQHTRSEFVVMINNDIEITSDNWLEQLVATAELDSSIASVGALLLYPDRTAQHAGIMTGFRGMAGHYYRGLSTRKPGYNGRLHAIQELSACTAALLLLRRSAFVEVGEFDALRFPTSFNDVDLGLRLRRSGYRCIYNPAVQAIHFETRTRRINYVREKGYHADMRALWTAELQHDPFHNRNVSLFSDSFRLFRTNSPDVEAIAAELTQPAIAERETEKVAA